jgi:hypothetical protein
MKRRTTQATIPCNFIAVHLLGIQNKKAVRLAEEPALAKRLRENLNLFPYAGITQIRSSGYDLSIRRNKKMQAETPLTISCCERTKSKSANNISGQQLKIKVVPLRQIGHLDVVCW